MRSRARRAGGAAFAAREIGAPSVARKVDRHPATTPTTAPLTERGHSHHTIVANADDAIIVILSEAQQHLGQGWRFFAPEGFITRL